MCVQDACLHRSFSGCGCSQHRLTCEQWELRALSIHVTGTSGPRSRQLGAGQQRPCLRSTCDHSCSLSTSAFQLRKCPPPPAVPQAELLREDEDFEIGEGAPRGQRSHRLSPPTPGVTPQGGGLSERPHARSHPTHVSLSSSP